MILQALVAKITKLSLVTLQALCRCQSHHNTFSSDSPGSHCQSHQTFHNKLQISHATQLQQTSHAAQPLTLIFPLTTLVRNYIAYTYHMPQTNVRTEVPHASNALWYLPNICSRISQACLRNSASKSIRLSFNIAMISRWLLLNRTSSNSGMSHSRRTIKVCTSLKTLVTLSKPIIQPMSWSCTASCKGRVLLRLSILSTDMAKFLDHKHFNSRQWCSQTSYIQGLRQLVQPSCRSSHLSKHLSCVSRTYSQPQPVEIF